MEVDGRDLRLAMGCTVLSLWSPISPAQPWAIFSPTNPPIAFAIVSPGCALYLYGHRLYGFSKLVVFSFLSSSDGARCSFSLKQGCLCVKRP
jgi:hypothetical protein